MSAGPNSTELTRQALQIAFAALDRPESERVAWALGQCGNDDALRVEVQALLAADQTGEPRLEPGASSDLADDQRIGERMGRFRITAKIGSGGMGVVYRAEPEEGVARQPVALKLIKRGMDSDEIVRRFVRERGILGRLEHPNITRLLDGGVSEEGRPWFALELIHGEPLTTYCDRLTLSISARIDLFLQVCDAVEYAHRNLVIHRDLKPGNVLVTETGLVKLMDFGIAKLIDPAQSSDTRTQLNLMTPEYSAPEQFSGGAITTQTDVYQLGLMLAELLSGERLRTRSRSQDAHSGVSRRLQAVFSRRQAINDPQVIALAARRGSSVRALARTLRGDLDRIVRRATSEESERRYASVGAMADDLKRYRRNLPVLASGDSWSYLIGKFLRRHRIAVGAAFAVALVLLAAVANNIRETERLRVALAQSSAMQGLLEDVFLGADPYAAKAGDTMASDLLSAAVQRLSGSVSLPPALTAALWFKMGQAYVSMDDASQAISALQHAVEDSDLAMACSGLACVGNDPMQTRTIRAAARARLAHYALRSNAQADDDLAALDQSIAELRELGAPARAELSRALTLVGDLAFNRGEFTHLESLSAEVVALARNADKTPSTDLLMALVYRSGILRATGQIPLALEAAEEAIALMAMLGDAVTDYMRLAVEQKYGAALSATGRARDAEPLLHSALQKALALRGENSTVSRGLMWDLAMTQTELGQHAEAAVHYRTLLTYANEEKTANVYALHNALGRALRATGDAAGASLELAQAESSACAAPSMTLPCAIIKLNLADAEQEQQHLVDSQHLLAETEEFMMDTGGRAAMRWHLLAARQAIAEKDSGRATQALSDSRAVWNDPAQITPMDRIVWLQTEAKLGQLRGELAAARKALEDAAQLCRQHRPEDVLLQQDINDAIAQLH